MGKPTRSQKKQTHHCALCGSTRHRVDTCPLPGAAAFRETKKTLQKLQKLRPAGKVLRQEKKNRKSAKKSKDYRAAATKLYTPNNDDPGARPSEARRRKPKASMLPTCEEDAAQWLLDSKWVAKPASCGQCKKRKLSDLLPHEEGQHRFLEVLKLSLPTLPPQNHDDCVDPKALFQLHRTRPCPLAMQVLWLQASLPQWQHFRRPAVHAHAVGAAP